MNLSPDCEPRELAQSVERMMLQLEDQRNRLKTKVDIIDHLRALKPVRAQPFPFYHLLPFRLSAPNLLLSRFLMMALMRTVTAMSLPLLFVPRTIKSLS